MDAVHSTPRPPPSPPVPWVRANLPLVYSLDTGSSATTIASYAPAYTQRFTLCTPVLHRFVDCVLLHSLCLLARSLISLHFTNSTLLHAVRLPPARVCRPYTSLPSPGSCTWPRATASSTSHRPRARACPARRGRAPCRGKGRVGTASSHCRRILTTSSTARACSSRSPP